MTNIEKIIEDKVKEFRKIASDDNMKNFETWLRQNLLSALLEIHRSAYNQALEEVEDELTRPLVSRGDIFNFIKSKKLNKNI